MSQEKKKKNNRINFIPKGLMEKLFFLWRKIDSIFFGVFVLLFFFATTVFASTSANTIATVDGYIVPDENGNAILNNIAPQLVVTSPTQALKITVESGTTNPTINFNPLCAGGITTIPATNITSENAYDVNLIILASTTVASANPSWNCILATPTVTTIILPETSGSTTTLSKAIEVGFSGTMLSFDKPVRMLFPNDKGKKVGYTRNSTSFTEILSLCSGDSGAGLDINGECKVDVGDDLVIWTRHFTKFSTFSSVAMDTADQHNSTVKNVKKVTHTVTPATTPATIQTPATIPEATHTTTITESGVKLFDIILTIEIALLSMASDLVARVQFTSFGTVPTMVDMTYRIENSEGKEIFSEKDEVTVETEQLVTKKFKNLNIKNGKYNLFLTTIYGDKVKDEFRQGFEIKKAVSNSRIKEWIWIVAGLVIVGIAGLIIFLVIKRKK